MQKVRIMALGGLDEDGKNMYVIEIADDIFVVEAGIKYPESSQLGVEYIITDFSYLVENKKRIKGVFITHGHDDVMSALPFLLKEIDVDIYATALTAKYIEPYIDSRKRVRIIKRNDDITIAGHKIHSFPVMQSIADGIGLAF